MGLVVAENGKNRDAAEDPGDFVEGLRENLGVVLDGSEPDSVVLRVPRVNNVTYVL